MPLQGFEAGLGGRGSECFYEGWFCEGTVGVLEMVCKERSILGRLVDSKMVGECYLQISISVVS